VEQKQTSARFEFLDALRGLAILGVLSTHCAWFSGGEFPGKAFAFAGLYGVQLFFVVSAFTIFLTLERALSREPAPVRSFFIRRVLRIAPMFWVGILIYAFLPGREHYYETYPPGPLHYTLTALLAHGWHPFCFNNVVPGGWTIADEMSFYLLAPLLFFAIKNWKRAALFFCASLLIAWGAHEALRIATNHKWIFAQVPMDILQQFAGKWFPSQSPVFACGILAFYLVKALPEKFHTKQNGTILLAAALALLICAVGIGSHGIFTEPVVFALGFLLLMLALAVYPLPLIVNPAIRFLGRVSYSFYLLHFVFMDWEIKFLRAHFPNIFDNALVAYFVLFAITLVIVTTVSWLTWKFIEQPFIQLGARLARRLNDSVQKTSAPATGLKPAQN
jgi:peptidoglycan/LPS O-acetylase OafA/YrhL